MIKMVNKLSTELMELSSVIEKHNHVFTKAYIVPEFELGDELTLPLRFRARVFEPGIFRTFTFRKEDIIRNMNTIFKIQGNVANNELNVDHKNNRKETSSVHDLIGRVVGVEYNNTENSLWMDCEVTDRIAAEKVFHGSYKYVSLRINPISFSEENGEKVVHEFDFEELSIVRTPGYDNALITSVY